MDESTFRRMLERSSRWRAPIWFQRMIGARRDRSSLSWLHERGLSDQQVMNASWKVFVLTLVMESLILPALVFVFGLIMALIWPLLPLILASMLSNIPSSSAKREEKVINQESPRTISCLTMGLHASPSLETAMAFTAQRGNGILSDRFRDMIWQVLTRRRSDLLSAILDFNSGLSEASDGLKQSLYLIASVTYEHTREGMDRLLDKANLLVSNGLRRRVDEYVSSLSVPSMVLFAMGVVLPVMLFALLPLLSISPSTDARTESATGSSMEMMIVLLLLIFPAAGFLYARGILERNPLRAGGGVSLRRTPGIFLTMALSGALALAWQPFCDGPYGHHVTLMLITFPLCASIWMMTRSSRTRGRIRESGERDFAQALYQIGNWMLTGSGFEEAFEKTASSMKGSVFSTYAEGVSFQSRISRRSFSTLVASGDGLPMTSPMVEMAMATVVECSLKDPQAAGKVALNLAQNISDIKKSEHEVRDKLRAIIDMMRHTALLFAPIVMGVTSSLFLMISEGIGGTSLQSMTLPVGLYLLGLGLIIIYFTSSLAGETDWMDVGYQFATRTPITLTIFILSSLACAHGTLLLR